MKLFILLCPLLYGFLGRLFSPLFYLLLALFSLLASRLPQDRPAFPYEKNVRLLFYALLGFMIFQVIPLPLFLVRQLSPSTVSVLSEMTGGVPGFLPVSIVPFETMSHLFQLIVLAFFFRMLISVDWEKKEMISLLFTTALSGIVLIPVYAVGLLSLGTRHFAFYLVMVFPLAPALLLLKLRYLESSRGLVEKFLTRVVRGKAAGGFLLLTLGLAGGILLSPSRAALLSFFLSCLIFFMWTYYFKRPHFVRRRLRKVFLIVGVSAVALGLQSTAMHLAENKHGGAGESDRWKQTFSMIKDFPVTGAGFGAWAEANALYDPLDEVLWIRHANNGGLELLAEGGIVGGLLLSLLVIAPAASIFKKWRTRRHPQVKILTMGILVSLFAAAFHTVFNASLRVPSNLLVLVLLLALGIKITHYKREQKREKER